MNTFLIIIIGFFIFAFTPTLTEKDLVITRITEPIEGMCKYQLDKKQGLGLNLKFAYPCTWVEFQGRQGVAKAFKTEKGDISMSVIINKAEDSKKGYQISENYVRNIYRIIPNFWEYEKQK